MKIALRNNFKQNTQNKTMEKLLMITPTIFFLFEKSIEELHEGKLIQNIDGIKMNIPFSFTLHEKEGVNSILFYLGGGPAASFTLERMEQFVSGVRIAKQHIIETLYGAYTVGFFDSKF